MTELVDRLAELTGQRDRDVLDATLVEAFRDILVDIESASIYRRVGEAVYYAKSHGRNQAQSHALLVARGELEDTPRVGDIELF